eukprot:1390608-Alexandrium_andersonii.AAC.1
MSTILRGEAPGAPAAPPERTGAGPQPRQHRGDLQEGRKGPWEPAPPQGPTGRGCRRAGRPAAPLPALARWTAACSQAPEKRGLQRPRGHQLAQRSHSQLGAEA